MTGRRLAVLVGAVVLVLVVVGAVVGGDPRINEQPAQCPTPIVNVPQQPAPQIEVGSVAVDNASLYVVRDDEVLKLDKQTLKVTASGTLPPKKH